MTGIQAWAIGLYVAGTILAIWGPGITVARLYREHEIAKASEGGYDTIDALGNPEHFRPKAFADMAWGFAEFGFVALGVIFGSVASILLVIESSVLT